MQVWADLLRSSPPMAICLALLFFGSEMIDKASVVPVGLQVWLSYAGPTMMLVGGIGLILTLPHTIYRLYKANVPSARGAAN